MGQRNGLSAGDIAGVHMMYPLPTFKEVPKDPVFDPPPTIKEVVADPTFKEVPKDPAFDPPPTRKEVIQDPTFKEIRKDPVFDPQPTIKEVGRDPIGPGGGTLVEFTPVPIPGGQFGITPLPIPGGPDLGGLNPFVIAGQSRAQDPSTQALSDAIELAQQLGAALAQAQQQYSQLADAYAQALAHVEALQQGRG
jgi:hypothetical protein